MTTRPKRERERERWEEEGGGGGPAASQPARPSIFRKPAAGPVCTSGQHDGAVETKEALGSTCTVHTHPPSPPPPPTHTQPHTHTHTCTHAHRHCVLWAELSDQEGAGCFHMLGGFVRKKAERQFLIIPFLLQCSMCVRGGGLVYVTVCELVCKCGGFCTCAYSYLYTQAHSTWCWCVTLHKDTSTYVLLCNNAEMSSKCTWTLAHQHTHMHTDTHLHGHTVPQQGDIFKKRFFLYSKETFINHSTINGQKKSF